MSSGYIPYDGLSSSRQGRVLQETVSEILQSQTSAREYLRILFHGFYSSHGFFGQTSHEEGSVVHQISQDPAPAPSIFSGSSPGICEKETPLLGKPTFCKLRCPFFPSSPFSGL